MPAIGALNVPASPPAAPAATSSLTFCSLSRSSCASSEPKADPRKTIGPCRPTEPPDPMVSEAATTLATAPTSGSRAPRVSSAAITSGIECPRADGTARIVIGATSSAPIAGIRINRAAGSPPSHSPSRMSKKNQSLRSTSEENPTAPSPAPSPTIAASAIGPARGERSMFRVSALRSSVAAPLASGVIRSTPPMVAPRSLSTEPACGCE